MKKVLALILTLCVCVGLCACQSGDYKKAQEAFVAGEYAQAQILFTALGDYEDSVEMAKQSGYLLGREQMEAGEYAKAIETFKALGSYEDCESLIAECEVKEIDAILQGTWKSVMLETIVTESTFDNGRYSSKVTAGTSSLGNEGSYRIDNAEKTIYICYDYIISFDGTKTPNKEEQLLFVYAFEDGEFKLYDADKERVYTKQ